MTFSSFPFLMNQPTINAAGLLVNLSGAIAARGLTPPDYYMLFLHMLMSLGLNPIMDMRDIRGTGLWASSRYLSYGVPSSL